MNILMAIHRVAILFHCFQFKLEFRMVVFAEGGKLEYAARSKDENQQWIQPTSDTVSNIHMGHIGGRQVLSPLHHIPTKLLARRASRCPVDAQFWEKMMKNAPKAKL